MRDSTIIMRNVAATYAGTLTILVVGFFLTPFLISRLGDHAFGLWAVVGSLMVYGGLLDLGLDGAVVKYIGEHTKLDDVEAVETVIHTSLAVYLAIAAAALAFTGAAAWLFPIVFPVDPDLVDTSRLLIGVAGLSLALNFPLGMYNGVLLGLQRHHIASAVDIAWALGTAAGAVAVVSRGGGLVGLALVYLVGNTLGQVFRISYLRYRHPDVRWFRVRLDRPSARKIFSFSFYGFLLRIAATLRQKTGELVIGASLTLAAVTPYYVGLRLGEMLDRLTGQLSSALLPYGSHLDARDDRERLSAIFVMGTRLNLAIAAPMALFLLIEAPRFIEAWIGPGYASSALVARLLITATLLSVYVNIGRAFLKSTGRHQSIARWAMVEAATVLVLTITLVRVWGIAGVAAGILIAAFGYNTLLVLPHACSRLGVGLGTMLRRSLLPHLPAAAMAAAVCLAVERIPGGVGIARLLAEAAVTGSTYWIGYYLTGASRDERELVRRTLQRSRRSA